MTKYTFTDKEIEQVEEILIQGKSFCPKRREILTNFDESIEIQAVPGSGKTTLLVAKLFLLAQRIDFERESVCILTHTNVAVDEIKRKLIKAKSNNNIEKVFIDNIERILKFPNYIGTLQSFIDKYLAIPGYLKLYGKRPNRIDDEYVAYILRKLFYERLSDNTRKGISMVFDTKKGIQVQKNEAGIERLNKTYLTLVGGKYGLVFNKTSKYGKMNIKLPPTTNLQKNRYEEILKIKKEQVIEEGYLTFQEANYFAEHYFNSHNLLIRNFLQKRFDFVFLDEIQDTNGIHINLLNQTFSHSSCIIQGFGDKNQAILEGDNEEGYTFTLFEKEEKIDSSNRLSVEIAGGVWKCALNPLKLGGVAKRSIPIYFYVYDDSSKDKLINFYKEKINEYSNEFESINLEDRVFKVIGRTHDGIKEYYSDYKGKGTLKKEKFLDYFQEVNKSLFEKEGFKIYKDNILDAIIRLCNISGIKNGNKGFSKTTFLKYLKEKKVDYYNELLKYIYRWSKKIYNGSFLSEESDIEIMNLLDKLKKDGVKLNFKDKFFNTSKSYISIGTEVQAKEDNLGLKYGTIHGVKGETHTGTLILDIMFKRYETNERILKFINDENNKSNEGTNIKDSIKLYYVGMTRATHLLVIGVNKSHTKLDELSNLNDTLHKIIE